MFVCLSDPAKSFRNLQQQSLEKYAKQKETIEDVLDITTIEKGMNDLETGIVLFTSFREQQLIDERSVPRKHLVRGDQAAKYLSERPFFEEFNSTRELVLAYAQGALEHHKQLLVK